MTRKLLLGTTAIVAGGVVVADMAEAADPIRLEIRGYRNEYFGVSSTESDVTDENFGNTVLRSEGEVHFRGATTLDNGIEIGVQVELEAIADGDQIDENYVDISGGFGEFRIGSDDPAGQKVGVVSPGVGAPISSGWVEDFIPAPTGFETGGFGTTPNAFGDNNAITYFSPRFAGFQIGATYVPTVDEDEAGEGENSLQDDDERDHGLSAGLNFSRSFNGIDVEAGAGIQFVDEPDQNDAAEEEITIYNFGAAVGFGGFTVGGSIGIHDEDDASDDGYAWDAGVSYETGPWGVSAQVVFTEFEGDDTANGDDEAIAFGAGVAYALGPGIKTDFTVIYADYDAESGGEDGDGIAAVLGLSVGF